MPSVLSPATVEGWYALHQIFHLDRRALRALDSGRVDALSAGATALFAPPDDDTAGWSAAIELVGGGADLLFVHFRPDLEGLAAVKRTVNASDLAGFLHLEYDFLSVTEAGLYHATASLAAEHGADSDAFSRALAERIEVERASEHVRRRIFPRIPEGMRYVTFYPMSKRRQGQDNWYSLGIEERSRLMRDHGMTGRRYAGKVFQVITGSVGFEDWEWGVTLFAHEALDFKRLVTDMRYDEVSARYGEFGRFFTGIRMDASAWPELLGAP